MSAGANDRRPRRACLLRPLAVGCLGLAVGCLGLAVGCLDDGPPLTRLTEAWGGQIAETAAPAVAAGLVVGGLSAVLCVQSDEAAWSTLAPGDVPPIPTSLWKAMGEPTIEEIELIPSGALHATLQGVHIMDRDSAKLRFTTAPGTASFGFEAVVIDGKLTDYEAQTSEPFGNIAFEVQADCTVGRSRVDGSARWTDLADRMQELTLPADRELSSGVGFEIDTPYLPNAGNLGWTGHLDGQEITVTTFDAADIRVTSSDDTGDPLNFAWPVWVRGSDWVVQSSLDIAP